MKGRKDGASSESKKQQRRISVGGQEEGGRNGEVHPI